jgi:hypothetical protein
MTDEVPKPKRKRWRWIIAGVLLFVVAGAGWWNWPRGDARFVGKWAVSQDHGVFEVWQFDANGMMHIQGVANENYDDVTKPDTMRWFTEGDLLRLGSPSDWTERFAISCKYLFGFRPFGLSWGNTYRARWLDDGVLRLEDDSDETIARILRRIPE